MTEPVNVREALLLEALGEMGAVLDRVEAVICELEEVRRGTSEASGRLAKQLTTAERRMIGLAELAKQHVVDHLTERTTQATRRSIEQHVKAMDEAARKLFEKELDPALRALVQPLFRFQEFLRENARPWDIWLTHAATAVAASLATWLIASGAWRP